MLCLKKLSLSDGEDIYQLLQEIAANDCGFHNRVAGMTFAEYRTWLENEFAVDSGRLEDWMVPQSSYWLYADGVPVGYGRIRHELNDALRETSGHIGYAIAHSKRGLGYGNKILGLLKEKCMELGITEVQIGANVDNVRSNRIILHHGGVLLREHNGKNFYQLTLTFSK